METANLLAIEDLALMLRRSTSSIHVARTRNPKSLPPGFKIGRRLFWRAETVDDWLREQERSQTTPQRKR